MNASGPRRSPVELMTDASLEVRLQAALQMIPADTWYALPSGAWMQDFPYWARLISADWTHRE